MAECSLLDAVQATLQSVDARIARDREAQVYTLVQERTAYFQKRMEELRTELEVLKRLSSYLTLLFQDAEGEQVWRQTCQDLREREPVALQSPSRALTTGGVDLLQLVEYTGAAIALTVTRRQGLVERARALLEDRHRRSKDSACSQAAGSPGPLDWYQGVQDLITQMAGSGDPACLQALDELWEHLQADARGDSSCGPRAG